MTEFNKLKERMLKKPGVRNAYDEMAPEYAVAAELIRSRIKAKMTQAQVAKRMKTTQSVVARMESGGSLPSMTSIAKYATATGEALSITIEPAKRRQKAA